MSNTASPKIRKQALERSEGGLCEYMCCKSNHNTELHHIVKGKGNRILCERLESVLFLCWEHHYGNSGVHGKNGHAIDLQLKLDLQQVYINMGMTEEEVRSWMGGKIYSEGD